MRLPAVVDPKYVDLHDEANNEDHRVDDVWFEVSIGGHLFRVTLDGERNDCFVVAKLIGLLPDGREGKVMQRHKTSVMYAMIYPDLHPALEPPTHLHI